MKKVVNMMVLSFGVIFMLQGTSYADPCTSVKREMTYGRVALQDAKNKQDYLDSAKQFEAAIDQAPSCAAAHFNLGVVYEKAGEYQKALKALKEYLSLTPGASDADKVQEKIYELEYRNEKAGEKEEARKTIIGALVHGTWCDKEQFEAFGAGCASGKPGAGTVRIHIHGTEIEINVDWHNGSFSEYLGTIQGLKLTGDHTVSFSKYPSEKYHFNGSISADGKIINIASTWHGSSRQNFIRVR